MGLGRVEVIGEGREEINKRVHKEPQFFIMHNFKSDMS